MGRMAMPTTQGLTGAIGLGSGDTGTTIKLALVLGFVIHGLKG
jgi:hypothetical protein